MSQKLVLIDGHSILNRAFYGVPDLSNAEGLHTNAIYGFLNIMFKILEEEKPDYLAVAFDVHAPTFRHQMYQAYKGTRKPMPEELRQQVPVMKEVPRRSPDHRPLQSRPADENDTPYMHPLSPAPLHSASRKSAVAVSYVPSGLCVLPPALSVIFLPQPDGCQIYEVNNVHHIILQIS